MRRANVSQDYPVGHVRLDYFFRCVLFVENHDFSGNWKPRCYIDRSFSHMCYLLMRLRYRIGERKSYRKLSFGDYLSATTFRVLSNMGCSQFSYIVLCVYQMYAAFQVPCPLK
jgi:hypothetical protein